MTFKELDLDINVVQQWKNEINSIMTTPIPRIELERTRRLFKNDELDFFITESFGTFILEAKGDDERASVIALLGKIFRWCKSKPKIKLAKFINAHIIDYQNDRYDRTMQEPKATCKAGCGFCCYQQVLMTTGESLLIKTFLKDNPDTKVDGERMKLHKSWAQNDRGSAWDHPKISDKACPFLHDNLCSIYPVRPFACRNHRSIDDPKLCDLEGGRNDVRFMNFFPVALFLNAYAATDDLRPIAHYWTELEYRNEP